MNTSPNLPPNVPVSEPTPEALRDRLGQKAAHDLWEAWCDRLEAEAVTRQTVAGLLRSPAGRAACRKAVAAGKAYSADAERYARRPVVRQAVALLRERLERRESAKRVAPEPGKYTRLAAERRRDRIVSAVRRALQECGYRVSGSRWAGGDHTATVHVGDQRWRSHDGAGAVGAEGGSRKAWSRNGKWSGFDSHHIVQVKPDWLEAVQARDLEVCDGMLTLDAEPIQGTGPELFRAVWVEQGRGFELKAVRGYVARSGDTTYHAASARAALDGLARKLGQKPPRRKGTVDLDRLVRRHGDLPVYWGDHDGIACDSGTRSWCRAVGINPESGCTVADVVAGYRLRPHPEALQVVRRVVRSGRAPLDVSVPASGLELPGRVVFDAEGGFRIEPENN